MMTFSHGLGLSASTPIDFLKSFYPNLNRARIRFTGGGERARVMMSGFVITRGEILDKLPLWVVDHRSKICH